MRGRAWFAVAACVFASAVALALFLPNEVGAYGWTSYSPVPPPPPPGVIDHRVPLRVAIVVAGALVALAVAAIGRRRASRRARTPGTA